MKVKLFLVVFVCFTFLISYSLACSNSQNKVIEEGKELAQIHCVSCHAFPDPSLLSKKAWTDVFPKMAELMYVDGYYNHYDISGPQDDRPASRKAPEQLFPYDKWEKIVKYYMVTAPSDQPGRPRKWPEIKAGLNNIATHFIYNITTDPFTTLVRFDTNRHQIFFADGNAEKLFALNTDFNLIDSFSVFTGATDVKFEEDHMPVITMGILKPSDGKLGKLAFAEKGKSPIILIDSLQRPVQATYADLDGDGKEDIIISEFGFRYGCLAWFESEGDNRYKKHLLRDLPGATRSEVFDLNKDGKPDIICLMAQGDEGIFLYYNEGKGKFREERALQLPPVYGSNYFQLFDFNKDGYVDILLTNGDNADYSMVLKAYHGIRIFLNDGTNHFKENVFLPVYGVQKAMPVDMDNDGDVDLVSISFFPDYAKNPKESFIYWENSGNDYSQRFTFEEATAGRWITMDVGDMDRDGDSDIILGNAVLKFGNEPDSLVEKWNKRSPSIVILENKLNNK